MRPYRETEAPVEVTVPHDWRMTKTLLALLAWSAWVLGSVFLGNHVQATGFVFALIIIDIAWTVFGLFYLTQIWEPAK